MAEQTVLIVDDEKNIRLTLSLALEPMGLQVDTAVNGEEALGKIADAEYAAVLLDLKMPGIDGMEVLRRARVTRPAMPVIIVTAHGSIDSAVEAMKLGAVDFIQKPFAPEEIRELVSAVLRRWELDERSATDYDSKVELAKLAVMGRDFAQALQHAREAVGVDPGRPQALNLLGAVLEIEGDLEEAQKSYRAALAVDPTYKPARDNLSRTTRWGKPRGEIVIELPEPDEPAAAEKE